MKEHLYRELYELEENHWWFAGRRDLAVFLLKRYLQPRTGSRILDAGCGTGMMLTKLSDFGKPYGMDCSREAIRYSRSRFKGTIKIGTLPGTVPFQKGFFDAVLLLDVLEHIDDDLGSLKKIREHLKDDGICIITVPAFMILWSGHDVVHDHRRRYTRSKLQAMMLQAGFSIERISYFTAILFLPILAYRFLHMLKKDHMMSDARTTNRTLNRFFYWISAFERFLLRFFNFCFGVSIIAVGRKQRDR